ncbi:hypothetical protein Y1Q_0007692 [Alligator mississippiensis]|uniref:KRAB domain-containing protein n=1 Tax=Alligator mississippiensis TaxID=8496 RepID=A0A151NTS4_ALLMI|nr:hypothetical protein Y1Q_0007692 [Alligator mississippiensis]
MTTCVARYLLLYDASLPLSSHLLVWNYSSQNPPRGACAVGSGAGGQRRQGPEHGGQGVQLPVVCEAVAVCFMLEEWELLDDEGKELYRDWMLRHSQALVSLEKGFIINHCPGSFSLPRVLVLNLQ